MSAGGAFGGNRGARPVPPEKGIFPLDHLHLCDLEKKDYIECLKSAGHKSERCRQFSKKYLECRMEKNLMAKQDMSELGFKKDMDVEHTGNGGSERIEASVDGDSTTCGDKTIVEPYEGMAFDSEDAGRACYDKYAGEMGFLTRVLYSRRSERDGGMIARGLGCRGMPDGHKSSETTNETGEKRREGCTAMLALKRDNLEKWVVLKFVRDHNHPLVLSTPDKRHVFDKKDRKIQELTTEIRVKKRLSAVYREQLLTLMKDIEDHTDHLTTKIQLIRNNLDEIESRNPKRSNQDKGN